MFIKQKKHILSLVFLIVLVDFFIPSSSIAGLRINKPRIKLTITPGSYTSGEIEVRNIGKEPLSVRVYLEDWVYKSQEGAKEFYPKGTTELSCSDWITFYPADLKLSPGASEVVHYTVTVPEDAKGGYFSVMFFEMNGGEVEKLDKEGNAELVKILTNVGALFYIQCEGTIKKTAEIKNLDIYQKLNDFILNADFFNTGNTYINARGTLDVFDSQGYVYIRGEFPQVYTLPEDKAVLHCVVQSANLKPGTYDLLITLEFEDGGDLVKEGTFTVLDSGAITSVAFKN